jgi:microcystin-dependent protein
MKMDSYIGTILPWAGNRAPDNWTLCDGRLLQVFENQALYSLIGNTYGGSGSTFALPDLRGRVIVGTGSIPSGNNNYTTGQQGGYETVTLSEAQMPYHYHMLIGNSSASAVPDGNPTGNILGTPANNIKMYVNTQPTTQMHPASVAVSGAGAHMIICSHLPL